MLTFVITYVDNIIIWVLMIKEIELQAHQKYKTFLFVISSGGEILFTHVHMWFLKYKTFWKYPICFFRYPQ